MDHPVYIEGISEIGKVMVYDTNLAKWTPFVHWSIFDVFETVKIALQAHKFEQTNYVFGGYKCFKPLGLYKDTACTIPAEFDGDLIAAWRDELSLSGFVATQPEVGKRPTLRFIQGKPTVRFYASSTYLESTIPLLTPPFSTISSFAMLGDSDAFARVVSLSKPSFQDWSSNETFAPIVRTNLSEEIMSQYTFALNFNPITYGQFTNVFVMATGDSLIMKVQNLEKSTFSINNSAISVTQFKIGGSYSFNVVDDLLSGCVSAVCIGNVDEAVSQEISDYYKLLSPTSI